MKEISKLSLQVTFIASLAFLAALMLVAANAVFWTAGVDDFHIKMYISEHGHWDYLKTSYLHWDGRAVSPLFFFRNLLILHLPAEVIAVFTTIIFIAVAWFLQEVVASVTGSENEKWITSLTITVLVTLSLWMTMRPHMARSIYWPTGSIYTLFNFSVFAALYYTFKKERSAVLVYILAFIASLSGVNVAAGLFAVLFAARVLGVWKQSLKQDLVLFGIIIAGTALCSLAPGNFARAAATGKMSLSPVSLLKGFYVVFKEYFLMSKLLFPSAVVTGLFIAAVKKPFSVSSAVMIKWVIVFIVGSLATIAPFMLLPGSASKHTSVYFQTYLYVAVLLVVILLFQLLQVYRFKMVAALAAAVLLLWGTRTAYYQYKMGKGVKTQILKRYEFLESKRGTKELILVDSIIFPKNFFTTSIWEMTDDPGMYQNRMYSEYFGTGPVGLKSPSAK